MTRRAVVWRYPSRSDLLTAGPRNEPLLPAMGRRGGRSTVTAALGLQAGRGTGICQASASASAPSSCGRRGHPFDDVARLDHRRAAVAVLPAGLDPDVVGLAGQVQDGDVARARDVDGLDGGLGQRQRQRRYYLTDVLLELLAELLRREPDVAGQERRGSTRPRACARSRRPSSVVQDEGDHHVDLVLGMAPSRDIDALLLDRGACGRCAASSWRARRPAGWRPRSSS